MVGLKKSATTNTPHEPKYVVVKHEITNGKWIQQEKIEKSFKNCFCFSFILLSPLNIVIWLRMVSTHSSMLGMRINSADGHKYKHKSSPSLWIHSRIGIAFGKKSSNSKLKHKSNWMIIFFVGARAINPIIVIAYHDSWVLRIPWAVHRNSIYI